MRFNVRKRFDGWVQGLVQDAVKKCMPCTDDVLYEVVNRMDMGVLANLLAPNDCLTRAVAEQVGEEIDLDDLADKIAASRSCNIDAEDVARHIDAEDVASYVDVDTDTIASKVAEDLDASDVASELDYDKLAEALVAKLKEAWA